MTKAAEISEIARLAGIADPGPGVGSSVYKALFDGICQRFAIDAAGTMPQQAQAIISAAKLPYLADVFDSRLSASGGGSTVTLEGLKALKAAVVALKG